MKLNNMNLVNIKGIIESKNDHCQRHGKTVFVSFMGGEFGCKLCKDEQAELARQQQILDDMAKQKTKAIAYAGINLKLPSLDNWQIDQKHAQRQESLLAKLKIYAENFCSDNPNILIIGGTGTGKTLIANAVAKIVFEKCYSNHFSPVAMIKTADFTRECKASWTEKDKPSEFDVLKRYGNVDFLVLDDLGDGDTATSYEHANADRLRFGQLINKRYQKSPTLITTNLSLVQVQAFLGDRAWDRFSQNLVVIECNWESYRATHRQLMTW